MNRLHVADLNTLKEARRALANSIKDKVLLDEMTTKSGDIKVSVSMDCLVTLIDEEIAKRLPPQPEVIH